MKELINALAVVQKWESTSYSEILQMFNKYSGQQIPLSVINEFIFTGLHAVDMITSDYLIQKGYKNIYQVEEWKELSKEDPTDRQQLPGVNM